MTQRSAAIRVMCAAAGVAASALLNTYDWWIGLLFGVVVVIWCSASIREMVRPRALLFVAATTLIFITITTVAEQGILNASAWHGSMFLSPLPSIVGLGSALLPLLHRFLLGGGGARLWLAIPGVPAAWYGHLYVAQALRITISVGVAMAIWQALYLFFTTPPPRRAALGAIGVGVLSLGSVLSATHQDAPMQGYYGIRPGISTKAQVDLSQGEPLRKLSPDDALYEYAPARGDQYSQRVVIRYEPGTGEVARLDVYLKTSLRLAEIRDRYGTRVASRDRAEGGREEVYYPQLQALIFPSRAADAPVVGISHLSPRTMGAIFIDRFEEMMTARNFEEARTEADKAVVVDPDGAGGYLAQGRYYASQQNYDEALVRYTAALSAKYSAAEKYRAQLQIANVYATTKRADQASAAYQRAIDMAPRGDITARRALADFHFDRNEYAAALRHFEALAQQLEPVPDGDKDGAIYFRYAYCLAQAGRDAQAIAQYEQSLALTGPRAGVLNNLGLLNVKAGKVSTAIDQYRAALKVDQNNQLLYRNLAVALVEAGQPDEARRQAEIALTMKADDSLAMFTIARSWGAKRKKKETLQWLQLSVAAGFRDRQALLTDRLLEQVRDDSEFKRILAQVK